MWVLLIVLVGVVLSGLAAGYANEWNIRRKTAQSKPEEPPLKALPEGCCGQHTVCEKEVLLAAVNQKTEYYDDEELDRFKGRASDRYTPEETEEFRHILYTMQENDVAGWSRSLQLRGIELPDDLKDEVILIVGEKRYPKNNPL